MLYIYIYTGDVDVGINPKICNLVKSYKASKYEIIWVCDSNVIVKNSSLKENVEILLQPDVGLVHQMPLVICPKSFGGELESVYFGTAHSRMYIFVNFLSIESCVIGKSVYFRKSCLDQVGGLSFFAQYLAEDNKIGEALWGNGWKHELSPQLCYQPVGKCNYADFASRRTRWLRLRKFMLNPIVCIVEPLTECVCSGILASLAFHILWGLNPLNFFAFHAAMWFVLDFTFFQCIHSNVYQNVPAFLLAWVWREFTSFPLFIYAVSGNTIQWRGLTFALEKGTKVRPLEEGEFSRLNIKFWGDKVLRMPFVVGLITAGFMVVKIVVEIL
jgi:ceramide glucosyltransferase